LYETITLVEIMARKKWLNDERSERIRTDALEISKMLNSLIYKINQDI